MSSWIDGELQACEFKNKRLRFQATEGLVLVLHDTTEVIIKRGKPKRALSSENKTVNVWGPHALKSINHDRRITARVYVQTVLVPR